MQEAPPPPLAPAPEPKKDRKARRREKFGPSLDEQIQTEEAQKEFEGGRPVSTADWADAETVAQRVFSGRDLPGEEAESAAPEKKTPETPETDPEIPDEELRKAFEEALAAAIPGEDERPSPARAAAEPEPIRRAASRAARPTQPRRDVPKPRDDAARDLEVTGISAPTDELAAAGVTQEELAANHRERIAEMQRMNPGWESATGLGAAAKTERGGERRKKMSPEPAQNKPGETSPGEAGRPNETAKAAERVSREKRSADPEKIEGEVTGVSAPSEALAAAGVTRADLEASHRERIAEMQRLNPGWKSATGLDAGQGAESGAAAAEVAQGKKPKQKASVVWSPAGDSAARLAEYRLEKQGLRGAELASALPAERRRRAEAMREAAGAKASAEAAPSAQVGAARKKRQPILQNVPDAPSPTAAPEPIEPEVLARDAASIQKQRDRAAAEIRAARGEWTKEVRGGAGVSTLAELDKKIEEKRRRAPKKGDGENVRAAVASVAAARGSSPSAAAEVGLTEPGSFENFYAVLRARTPAVIGSAQEYSADEIVEIVEAIRRGEPGIGAEHLTRTFGIREAAMRLIEAERLERARAALGIVAATPAGAPVTRAAGATAARPRLVVAGGGAGGAGTPPPPAGGPANVPPAPGGRRGVTVAPTPATPPQAAAPTMGVFARVGQLGVGAVGAFQKFVEEPSSWLWKKAERPGSYNTKEAPFKDQTSIFAPITQPIGALWKIIGGWFGAKFETPKEEKKK